MNFFGHSVLASRQDVDPAFVLGSMLPDFATMIRARPPEAKHARISAGIAHHHATDLAFHDAPLFRGLCNDAFEQLQALGVRRGSARAVAHVGIELLLDSVLAHEAEARTIYERAIEHAADALLGSYVHWPTQDVRDRFGVLRAALERRGGAAHDGDPELIAARLSRTLAGRPRLELDVRAEAHVVNWARSTEATVSNLAGQLIAQVEERLSAGAALQNGLVDRIPTGG